MGKLNIRKKIAKVICNSTPTDLPQDTKDRLIQVAKSLFAQKGFDGTTVKDISNAARVNISLVSYHFHGKEGLFRACLEESGKGRLNASERILQSPTSIEELKVRLQLFIEEIFLNHIQEPEFCQIIARECEMRIPIVMEIFKNTLLKCHENLVQFFKTAQDRGLVRKEMDVEIMTALFFGGILHMTQKDHMNEIFFNHTIKDQKYRELVISQTVSFFLKGCCQL